MDDLGLRLGPILMSSVETGQMTAAETSVLSQQKKAQVQSWLTKVPVPSKNIKFGPKWVQNRRFGLKLGPEACQDRSRAFGMGLTYPRLSFKKRYLE